LSGGFTLPNLAKFATMFLLNLALGNPIGQMQARRSGGRGGRGLLAQGSTDSSNLDSLVGDLPTDANGIAEDRARPSGRERES
jgi:hypothetical protein